MGAAASVAADKAMGAVEGAKRAMGMPSDRKEQSLEDMGAAGKMEHATPGTADTCALTLLHACY